MEKNYLKAISFAITLDQPLRVLNITKGRNFSDELLQCEVFTVTVL